MYEDVGIPAQQGENSRNLHRFVLGGVGALEDRAELCDSPLIALRHHVNPCPHHHFTPVSAHTCRRSSPSWGASHPEGVSGWGALACRRSAAGCPHPDWRDGLRLSTRRLARVQSDTIWRSSVPFGSRWDGATLKSAA